MGTMLGPELGTMLGPDLGTMLTSVGVEGLEAICSGEDRARDGRSAPMNLDGHCSASQANPGSRRLEYSRSISDTCSGCNGKRSGRRQLIKIGGRNSRNQISQGVSGQNVRSGSDGVRCEATSATSGSSIRQNRKPDPSDTCMDMQVSKAVAVEGVDSR